MEKKNGKWAIGLVQQHNEKKKVTLAWWLRCWQYSQQYSGVKEENKKDRKTKMKQQDSGLGEITEESI